MVIASIDQSLTKTAICIFDTESLFMIDFKLIKSIAKIKGKIVPFEYRMISIGEDMLNFIHKYNVNQVIIEGLAMNRNTVTARPLAGLFYYINIELIKNNIPYFNLPPKTVKKFATGSGNATKDEMIKALPKKVLQKFMDAGIKKTTGLHDLADAYFIGLHFSKVEKEKD